MAGNITSSFFGNAVEMLTEAYGQIQSHASVMQVGLAATPTAEIVTSALAIAPWLALTCYGAYKIVHTDSNLKRAQYVVLTACGALGKNLLTGIVASKLLNTGCKELFCRFDGCLASWLPCDVRKVVLLRATGT